MAKKIKKLVLNKETIRQLTDTDLENVNGAAAGWDTKDCPTKACPPTVYLVTCYCEYV